MQLTISLPRNAVLFFGFPNTAKGKQQIQAFQAMLAQLPHDIQSLCEEPSCFEHSALWHFQKTYFFKIQTIETLQQLENIINAFGKINEFVTHTKPVISLKSREEIDDFYEIIQEYYAKQVKQ